MYRIELKPGEETALRTVEELAIGIRNGMITPRARVWHSAGQKWLPIECHPHYQAALKQVEGQPSPAGEQLVAPGSTTKPVVDEPTAPALPVARRQRSTGRPVGLAVGGIALVAGAQMAFSALPLPSAPDAVPPAPRVTAPRPTLAPAPAVEATVRLAANQPVSAPGRVPGGAVVHGPVQVAPPARTALAATPIAKTDSDTMPAIPPAPSAMNLAVPHLAPDLPSAAEPDSTRQAKMQRILDAIVEPAPGAAQPGQR